MTFIIINHGITFSTDLHWISPITFYEILPEAQEKFKSALLYKENTCAEVGALCGRRSSLFICAMSTPLATGLIK